VKARAIFYARFSAKCAPQKAMTPPSNTAIRPAMTPDAVAIALGAEAAWPAPARNKQGDADQEVAHPARDAA